LASVRSSPVGAGIMNKGGGDAKEGQTGGSASPMSQNRKVAKGTPPVRNLVRKRKRGKTVARHTKYERTYVIIEIKKIEVGR